MGNRQPIQDISGALRTTLENARGEYDAAVRRVRWGEGPIYVCGAGDCATLAMGAAYGFESLLGWPVVVRPVEVFRDYSLSLLRPRSVLVMISAGGEWPEAQELAQMARQRGCTLIGLTSAPESPLAKTADLLFLVRAEGNVDSPQVCVCLYAALNFMAFEVARVLKRPDPHWNELGKDFEQLPGQIEWVFRQLPAVLRSTAAAVVDTSCLRIVGGGFNYYPAARAARQMKSLAGVSVAAVEASTFSLGAADFARRGDAVLFLSGSHAKNKKLIHHCAAQARSNGARVLSLTDGNDRELVEQSDLGILIPPLLEMPGSTLTHFMLEWLAFEALRAPQS